MNTKRHPLSSAETFEKWLKNSFGCIHCVHLDKNVDLPIHERKCTNEKALIPRKDYPNGVEGSKSWMRENDLSRKVEGMKSEDESRRKLWKKQEMKDINEYFVCDYFNDNNIDLSKSEFLHKL